MGTLNPYRRGKHPCVSPAGGEEVFSPLRFKKRLHMADATRYYRKNVDLFLLIDRIKLWPSRKGYLHGIRSLEIQGDYVVITTHCGEVVHARNSRNSRAARWLRNKLIVAPCPKCQVPDWKIEKYSNTYFSSKYGSDLRRKKNE
jgi:pyrrolysyl-tRNA synthetase-like protein